MENEDASIILPPEWVFIELGDIVQGRGKSIFPSNYPEELFELYSIPSHSTGEPEIVHGKDVGSSKQIVTKGMVLLSKINPRLNRSWIVRDFSSHRKIASSEWIIFPKMNNIDEKFLYYYLQTHELRNFLSLRASGVGGSLMRVKADTLQNYPFPLPPLAEQRRIVARVENLFFKLSSIQRDAQITSILSTKNKEVAITLAISGALTKDWRSNHDQNFGSVVYKAVSDAKEPFEIPDSWLWIPLAKLASSEKNSITDGPFGSNLKTEHYTEEGPRVIRLQNIGVGKFLDGEAHISETHFIKLKKHTIKSGDLSIAILGDPIPRCCVIPEGIGPAIVKSDCIRYKPDNARVVPEYLNYVINAQNIRIQLSGEVHGVARPRLNLTQLKQYLVPLPPLLEQMEIVKRLNDLFALSNKIHEETSSVMLDITQLRKSILRLAFRGELIPKKSNNEPGSN